MSALERYDAIVVGAGQAGGPLASALARSGKRTVLIEREHVGGTCINEGCTPTKTMVASARVAYLARRAADYGVGTGPVAVDMGRIRERKRAIVKSFRAGSLRRIEATDGLDLVCGEARFTGPRRVAVDGRMLGGRALELDESRGFMKALVDPGSGAILGAAVLGIEGGEMMAVLQLAMMGNVKYDQLRDAIFAHPTLAESLNNLFSSLES